jgi:hypothetical protein
MLSPVYTCRGTGNSAGVAADPEAPWASLPTVRACSTFHVCALALLQVLRQTQALKESLSSSDSRVTALQAEVAQLTAELEACRQKAVTDQEQVSRPCKLLCFACIALALYIACAPNGIGGPQAVRCCLCVTSSLRLG